ncbi:gamma-glutamyltransferase [Alcanivorax sp. 1008]|uniref:gamma-glutamyltransferase n=1 Tax=Alcanivorax sp. 1008 TaxID=2816853 RepID=UPI001DFA9626|nr:gamma-glutamyltransferase [Alcanivorax sp. 1008]MCC1496918.1 gamma-glutamyltransferase [Alcanivorax sp. 1008]
MKWTLRGPFAAILLFVIAATGHARLPAAAISSAHPLATEAGFAVLDQGGNAFDAAIAVSAALAVVEPYSSGMGGGGFWLLHDAANGRNVMIDGREKAPGAASRDMYLDNRGAVVRDWAINGPSAAGIPGQPAALAHLAAGYGKLPLSVTLAPAIRLAKDGFQVEEHYRRMANYRRDVLNRSPEARHIFLNNGEVPPVGHLIVQPELARLLELLADQGHDGFYRGELAQKLVDGVINNGGLWSMEDLANYQVVEREPVTGTFRGAKIISAAPPSSGGVVLIQALNILERFNNGQPDPALLPHLAVESMRRAYRDRALHLGDPDFVDMPINRLLDKDYATALAASIKLDQATPSASLGEPITVEQGNHTSHFSIIDQQGNRVSATLSINLPFGSGFVVPKTGLLLNNEMDDFSANPGSANAYGLIGGEANSIAAGKRPLSSMTPTFIEWDGKVAILGTPGGSRIISMVMLAALEALQGKPAEDWVSRPRFHHQYMPDMVQGEPDFVGTEAGKSLLVRGHQMESTGRRYGNMQAILWDSKTASLQAAADPRGIGEALVRKPERKD